MKQITTRHAIKGLQSGKFGVFDFSGNPLKVVDFKSDRKKICYEKFVKINQDNEQFLSGNISADFLLLCCAIHINDNNVIDFSPIIETYGKRFVEKNRPELVLKKSIKSIKGRWYLNPLVACKSTVKPEIYKIFNLSKK